MSEQRGDSTLRPRRERSAERITDGLADADYGIAPRSNLAAAPASDGIPEDAIPTTFNIFMNVAVSPEGVLSVLPPLSKPGDRIELRAEMDLIVGLTACSAGMSNNYAFKPIDWAVERA